MLTRLLLKEGALQLLDLLQVLGMTVVSGESLPSLSHPPSGFGFRRASVVLPASLLRLRGFTAPLRFAWLIKFGLPFATSLWHNIPPIAEIGFWVRL